MGYNQSLNYNNQSIKIGIRAGTDPLNIDFTDKKILFVDVCPTFNFILVQSKLANSITILDHHKTSKDMYDLNNNILKNIDNVKFVLDMDKSGCQIAWDYFYPKEPRTWFIDYIGDADLWKHNLPNTKEINASLDYYKLIDENNLDKMDELFKYNFEQIDDLIKKGTFINEFIDKLVNDVAEYPDFGEITINNKIYTVALGTITKYTSLFGNKLANKTFNDKIVDFSIVWFYNPKYNDWYYSLRGTDTSPDLSLIAKHFGGGGHPKASGFRTKSSIREIVNFY